MSHSSPFDKALAELAAASEELLQALQRRDPGYLEALERRAVLLERLLPLCRAAAPHPAARAALERIRQLGGACQKQARALREEALAELSALDSQMRFAQSLERLAAPSEPALLIVEA